MKRERSLSGSSLIPRHVTFDNFKSLFTHQQHVTGHATFQNAHYLAWFLNSMLVAGGTAVFTVLMSALVFGGCWGDRRAVGKARTMSASADAKKPMGR